MLRKDKVRLKDFIDNTPPQDFKEYWWNHSKTETIDHFNITARTFALYVKHFEIRKPKELINELRNSTNLKIYGVENQFHRIDHLNKRRIEKYGSLENLWRIGAEHAKRKAQEHGYNSMSQTPESKAKRKKTCLERYGVECVLSSREIQNKGLQTKLEKYGDASYHNIEKMKITNLQRYGVEYNFASKDENLNGKKAQRKRAEETGSWNNREQAIATCKERFGEDYYIKQIEKALLSLEGNSYSKINMSFANHLLGLGLLFEKEFGVGSFVYDFKLGKYLVELNPYPTHNSSWGIFNNPKRSDYHRKKTLNAIAAGYKCIHIWDWTDVDEILWGIMNHKLEFRDLGKEQRHIFNTKKKQLVNKFDEDCVEIYDDGFVIELKE